MYPQALSSRAFLDVAKALLDKPEPRRTEGQVQFFWHHLFQSQQLAQQNGRGD